MTTAVIVGVVRTAGGKRNGKLLGMPRTFAHELVADPRTPGIGAPIRGIRRGLSSGQQKSVPIGPALTL